MRIASLVPSATEMLFALGLGDNVVGVTHECDFPPEATTRARLTRSVIPVGLSPAEVDAAVRERVGRGQALYELDEDALRDLNVQLIVTQAVCAVCAVSYDDVRAVASRLPGHPGVLSLDPLTLADVLTDAQTLGNAAAIPAAGHTLRTDLQRRLDLVQTAVAGADRPRVLALEWLDPPFIGGHWVPEMIALAGGANSIGEPGGQSRTARWDDLLAVAPEVVVVMPCGAYVDEAAAQAEQYRDRLAALGADRVYAVDAAASFSRPGPRLVDGVELLGHLLHPSRVPAPAGVGYRAIEV
ncbi:MAG: ABC transporter substrate-binding protein [Actinomycetes bacterium]